MTIKATFTCDNCKCESEQIMFNPIDLIMPTGWTKVSYGRVQKTLYFCKAECLKTFVYAFVYDWFIK